MSRAKRISQRRLAAQARLTVVDVCEVDHVGGALTLRIGRRDYAPTCVAVPANEASSLIEEMRAASLAMEEQYRSVIHQVFPPGTQFDPEQEAEHIKQWHSMQRWEDVAGNAPADSDDIGVISHVGHVGLMVPWPYAMTPILLVFDPPQMGRLDPLFQAAVDMAAASAVEAPLAEVLVHLTADQWPQPNRALVGRTRVGPRLQLVLNDETSA